MKLQPRRSALSKLVLIPVFLLFSYSISAQDAPEQLTGNPEDAKSKISNCTGCHSIPGYKASFPEVYPVPMIAGQSEQYIITALNDYASGARSFPTMGAVAHGLSPQEIADVAAYYSSLQ
ncbi:c-type cytochrome [Paenalcaligenes niemegkensis]|nr:c-type cytochrome [Paenalcaligenes niemegkensis]MCQ9616979.1 c-type cytochrome [Paenalcaligenes niemegkensis]